MILTTKGRYAVIAMIDLVENSQIYSEILNPVSLLSIAKRQNISLSYLEQIFANLRKAEIVKAVKGPGGGYVLKRKADEITVADIIFATGGNIKVTNCTAEEKCAFAKEDEKKCKTHHLWKNLEKNILHYLTSITLANIVTK